MSVANDLDGKLTKALLQSCKDDHAKHQDEFNEFCHDKSKGDHKINDSLELT